MDFVFVLGACECWRKVVYCDSCGVRDRCGVRAIYEVDGGDGLAASEPLIVIVSSVSST